MSANPDHMQVSGANVRRWTIAIAAAVFVPIVLLGGLELLLRAANVGYPTALLEPCTVQGKPASCYNLFFAAPFFPNGMIQTPRPYSIPAAKAANTYRIVVLGESAAMGDPDPAYGFSRYLETMLRLRYPDIKFEVVNTGSVAINSHVTLPIAEQLAAYKPDLFIIYSGNNEVVGPYGPGTALSSSWSMQMPFIKASMFLHASRTGQLVTKLGTPKQQWRGMELFLDKQVRADSPLMQYAYANFADNLRDTIAAGQRAGARVIVSTVATNVRDCAPFASLHRDGLGAVWRDNFDTLVADGQALEESGAYSEALKRYRAAAQLDSNYAELHFRIARTLEAINDFPTATAEYVRARDLDTLRFRADSKINEVNRAIAATTPGTMLVDADALLSAASEHGAIGSDLVYEHVHLTPAANYLLAKAMFEKIAQTIPRSGGDSTEATMPTQAQCDQMLGLTRFDRARIAAEVLRRIQRPPFTTQLTHSRQVERFTTMAQGTQETPDETFAQYQWALSRSPADLMLHFRLGMFLYRYNQPAAAQHLRMSQPWDGFPVYAPDGALLN